MADKINSSKPRLLSKDMINTILETELKYEVEDMIMRIRKLRFRRKIEAHRRRVRIVGRWDDIPLIDDLPLNY